MAKRVSQLNKILNYSPDKVMSMSRSDLADAVSKMASAGNKRLVRFKKKNITTPATAYIKKHGGKFSVAGKNVSELREEYLRVKGFLESETGTIKGYRRWESKVASTLEKSTAKYDVVINPKTGEKMKVKIESGIDYNSLTERQKRIFWKAYAKLEELDQANVYGAKYKTSVNQIYQAVKGGLKMSKIDEFVTGLDDTIYKDSTQDFLTGENNPFNLI